MTSKINLVHSKEVALVDDEDYDWLMKYKWEEIDIDGKPHAFTIINGEGYLMENMIMEHVLEPHQRRNMK